ncbi:uncharacterized protein J3R85_008407 [Psidium guajava]|nr:uncharacterized protein J3R85_008407 [Psidium guajava]
MAIGTAYKLRLGLLFHDRRRHRVSLLGHGHSAKRAFILAGSFTHVSLHTRVFPSWSLVCVQASAWPLFRSGDHGRRHQASRRCSWPWLELTFISHELIHEHVVLDPLPPELALGQRRDIRSPSGLQPLLLLLLPADVQGQCRRLSRHVREFDPPWLLTI